MRRQLRLLVGDVAVADQSVSLEPIDADRFVIGVVSSDPTLLNTLEVLQISGSNGTVVRHLQPGDLPEQALALRSLNALFLHDLDSSQLSPAQRDALKLWTTLGGQLIVSGGVGGQRAASGLEPMAYSSRPERKSRRHWPTMSTTTSAISASVGTPRIEPVPMFRNGSGSVSALT